MEQARDHKHLRTAVALLRITLGLIILATWVDNVRSGLYTADGLTTFFNELFDPYKTATTVVSTVYHKAGFSMRPLCRRWQACLAAFKQSFN